MIAIFGGTFDPVHYGHLRPALELLQELPLRELRFVPCSVPPHREAPQAGAELRVAMLRAALEGQPGLVLDERELQRPGPSYTVDTLRSLREELGAVPLCLVIGGDAFRGLATWHRWEDLIELAHLIVMRRPGWEAPAEGPVAALYAQRRTDSAAALAQSPAGRILAWPVTQLDISASRIRRDIGLGKSPRYLLPDAVWELIRARGLYGCRCELDETAHSRTWTRKV
jgi:nicotinate-nucleotide adenylyltransferase